MPEFQLNTPPRPRPPHRPHPFYDLGTFARGYVEAMFFTSGDCGDERENLLNDWGVEKLTRSSVKTIKKQCGDFTGTIMPDGCFVRQWLYGIAEAEIDYDDEQAGRDFWFTRQGHGAGFWNRDQLDLHVWRGAETREYLKEGEAPADPAATLLGNLGGLLSAAAKKAGESYIEAYRGWIHVR